MIHCYIDTNIYLSFFSYTQDDIDQLKKLNEAIKRNQLTIYLPQQTIHEFERNREVRLSTAFKSFKVSEFAGTPRFANDLDEVAGYNAACAAYKVAYTKLVAKAREKANARELDADKLISQIMKSCVYIPHTVELYNKALERSNLHRPPGKENIVGDRLNWESLLIAVESKSNLNIISTDSDYESRLDGTLPHQALRDEWSAKNGGDLILYGALKPFLDRHFKAIVISAETIVPNESLDDEEEPVTVDVIGLQITEKSRASLQVDVLRSVMREFIGSDSFKTTHRTIRFLMPRIPSLEQKEIHDLLEAFENNKQISATADDDDVRIFGERLADKIGK